MTNTKFRKKALLSSVAMLLVALVALGSATFAWFTANLSASADGLKINTSTSAGLVARSASAASKNAPFSHNTKLDVTAYENGTYTLNSESHNLQPATLDLEQTFTATPTFYYTTANATNNYAKGSAGWSSTTNTRFWSEKVYLRTTENSDGVSINLTSATVTINPNKTNDEYVTDLTKAVRVALVSCDASGSTPSYQLLGVWKEGGASTNGYYKAAETAGISTTKSFISSGTPATFGGSGEPNSVTVTANNEGSYVEVFVYLDGQDSNCKSEAVTNAAELISGISISFTAS